MIRYRRQDPGDEALRDRMRELGGERRRFGYRRLHVLLRQEGLVVNRKRTQRIYREEGLIALLDMGVFRSILFLGLLYGWSQGALRRQ